MDRIAGAPEAETTNGTAHVEGAAPIVRATVGVTAPDMTPEELADMEVAERRR